jgi:transposase, IS5 family
MNASLKSLHTLVGPVLRGIDRKFDRRDETTAARAEAILARVKRVLVQKPKDKNKTVRCRLGHHQAIPKIR